MNLREFIKKVRSPMGMTILSLFGIVVLVMAVIPFLLRDDAGKIESIYKNQTKEGSYEISGDTKEINIKGSNGETSPSIQKERSDTDTGRSAASGFAPTPPSSSAKRPESTFENNRWSGENQQKSIRNSILLIDGDGAPVEEKSFISERYAPYGRLISCKMVNTVESGDTDTPLIAVVTEDLWWINGNGEKKLIIPAGTEVHGSVNGAKPMRNRLTSGNQFVLVWQATSDMVGFELQLNGIALEKSTYPDDRMLATISDMSAGIPGQVMSNENLSKFLMYTLAFGQGLAQGFQQNEVYSDFGTVVSTQDGTVKNALSRGAESMAQVMLQDVTQMIAKESYYIRVPAGTEFYLFITQVINLDNAKIADTLLNQLEKEKIQGNSQQTSGKDVFNAFSKDNK